MSQSQVADLEALSVDTGPSFFAYGAYFVLLLLIVGGVIGLVIYLLNRSKDEEKPADQTDEGTAPPGNNGGPGGGTEQPGGNTGDNTDTTKPGNNTGETEETERKYSVDTTAVFVLGLLFYASGVISWFNLVYQVYARVAENRLTPAAGLFLTVVFIGVSLVPVIWIGQELKKRVDQRKEDGDEFWGLWKASEGYVTASYVYAGLSIVPIAIAAALILGKGIGGLREFNRDIDEIGQEQSRRMSFIFPGDSPEDASKRNSSRSRSGSSLSLRRGAEEDP